MPSTDKKFFIEHFDEVQDILEKHHINKCILGRFKSTGLQMMLDAEDASEFYQVKSDLQALAIRNNVIFSVSFSAFSAAGQLIPLPQDAIDFKLLKNHSNLNSAASVSEGIEQSVPNFSAEINELLEKAKKLVQDIMVLKNRASNCSENKNVRDEIKSLIAHIEQEDAFVNSITDRITPSVQQEAFFIL